jgi:hypothetical protein
MRYKGIEHRVSFAAESHNIRDGVLSHEKSKKSGYTKQEFFPPLTVLTYLTARKPT